MRYIRNFPLFIPNSVSVIKVRRNILDRCMPTMRDDIFSLKSNLYNLYNIASKFESFVYDVKTVFTMECANILRKVWK